MSKGKSWRVISVKDTMTYSSLLVHIAVIDWSDESNFWSSEGVVSRETDIEKEHTILIGSLFRTNE